MRKEKPASTKQKNNRMREVTAILVEIFLIVHLGASLLTVLAFQIYEVTRFIKWI